MPAIHGLNLLFFPKKTKKETEPHRFFLAYEHDPVECPFYNLEG